MKPNRPFISVCCWPSSTCFQVPFKKQRGLSPFHYCGKAWQPECQLGVWAQLLVANFTPSRLWEPGALEKYQRLFLTLLFLSFFFLPFIYSFLTELKKDSKDFSMCHHNACTREPVLKAQRFQCFREELGAARKSRIGNSSWLGAVTCSPSTTWQNSLLPWTVTVRSQLLRVMSVSFPPRTDLLALGLGLNFASDSYSAQVPSDLT